MRDSFIFYRSFFEATKPLNNEQKAQLFDSICEYALNQTETEMEPMVNAMFGLIKPQLDANNNRYENGKKGGRPKKNDVNEKTKPKPNENQTETKDEPNVNVNVNENVNENDIIDASTDAPKKFSFNLAKASQYDHLSQEYKDKLTGYATRQDGAYQLESFLDHHLANGAKFKDWSRAYNKWVKNSVEYSKGSYKPEKHIRRFDDHPTFGIVYAQHGTDMLWNEDNEYAGTYKVQSAPMQVEAANNNHSDKVTALIGGLVKNK